MRPYAFLGCGIMMMALVVGCGGGAPEDAAMKESISVMNEISGIMESVKDEKTSKEAEAKVQALQTRLKDADAKLKALPKDKVEAAKKKYETEGKAAAERMMKAMMSGMMKGIGGMMPKFPG